MNVEKKILEPIHKVRPWDHPSQTHLSKLVKYLRAYYLKNCRQDTQKKVVEYPCTFLAVGYCEEKA